MKPHKHAELIHAWADGAEIQVKNGNAWEDCVLDPFWIPEAVYRIKPNEKVVRWLWAYYTTYTGLGLWIQSNTYMTDEDVSKNFGPGFKCRKLEYTRQEFDK